MLSLIRRFAASESGVTGIEYALIGSLVAVVIVSAVTKIGTTLSGIFTSVGGSL